MTTSRFRLRQNLLTAFRPAECKHISSRLTRSQKNKLQLTLRGSLALKPSQSINWHLIRYKTVFNFRHNTQFEEFCFNFETYILLWEWFWLSLRDSYIIRVWDIMSHWLILSIVYILLCWLKHMDGSRAILCPQKTLAGAAGRDFNAKLYKMSAKFS